MQQHAVTPLVTPALGTTSPATSLLPPPPHDDNDGHHATATATVTATADAAAAAMTVTPASIADMAAALPPVLDALFHPSDVLKVHARVRSLPTHATPVRTRPALPRTASGNRVALSELMFTAAPPSAAAGAGGSSAGSSGGHSADGAGSSDGASAVVTAAMAHSVQAAARTLGDQGSTVLARLLEARANSAQSGGRFHRSAHTRSYSHAYGSSYSAFYDGGMSGGGNGGSNYGRTLPGPHHGQSGPDGQGGHSTGSSHGGWSFHRKDLSSDSGSAGNDPLVDRRYSNGGSAMPSGTGPQAVSPTATTPSAMPNAAQSGMPATTQSAVHAMMQSMPAAAAAAVHAAVQAAIAPGRFHASPRIHTITTTITLPLENSPTAAVMEPSVAPLDLATSPSLPAFDRPPRSSASATATMTAAEMMDASPLPPPATHHATLGRASHAPSTTGLTMVTSHESMMAPPTRPGLPMTLSVTLTIPSVDDMNAAPVNGGAPLSGSGPLSSSTTGGTSGVSANGSTGATAAAFTHGGPIGRVSTSVTSRNSEWSPGPRSPSVIGAGAAATNLLPTEPGTSLTRGGAPMAAAAAMESRSPSLLSDGMMAAPLPSLPVVERRETPYEYLQNLKKTVNAKELAHLVATPDPFHAEVLACLVSEFRFAHMAMDAALRRFLARFVLPPESQQIDRVLQAFGKHYMEENPGVLSCEDDAHVLAFALVLLNSDLHHPAAKRKMSAAEFIGNTRACMARPPTLHPEILAVMYENIRAVAIQHASNDADHAGGPSTSPDKRQTPRSRSPTHTHTHAHQQSHGHGHGAVTPHAPLSRGWAGISSSISLGFGANNRKSGRWSLSASPSAHGLSAASTPPVQASSTSTTVNSTITESSAPTVATGGSDVTSSGTTPPVTPTHELILGISSYWPDDVLATAATAAAQSQFPLVGRSSGRSQVSDRRRSTASLRRGSAAWGPATAITSMAGASTVAAAVPVAGATKDADIVAPLTPPPPITATATAGSASAVVATPSGWTEPGVAVIAPQIQLADMRAETSATLPLRSRSRIPEELERSMSLDHLDDAHMAHTGLVADAQGHRSGMTLRSSLLPHAMNPFSRQSTVSSLAAVALPYQGFLQRKQDCGKGGERNLRGRGWCASYAVLNRGGFLAFHRPSDVTFSSGVMGTGGRRGSFLNASADLSATGTASTIPTLHHSENGAHGAHAGAAYHSGGLTTTPQLVLPVIGAVALYDPSYTRRTATLRLCLADGSEYLLQAADVDNAVAWTAVLNRAATYATCGVVEVVGAPAPVTAAADMATTTAAATAPRASHGGPPPLSSGTTTSMGGDGRSAVIRRKAEEMANQLGGITIQVANEVALQVHASLCAPMGKVARSLLDEIGRRRISLLRRARIEQVRLECYRAVLMDDLASSQATR
ncbi:hypothetical protein CXG81DRAFT_16413 [Caulochytrium protostelioides]|uniref:SEC7 domain-containing protein n=1 Tax=Caulochytrium protostelioides TaxID=1555241 RepID=A0A4V1IVI0_9FUNG|nr:hypothetical protein CXG81DRAFT_16413 [Caulochytrium protostelioides]|eukprot:RKP04129.1 hypothetical protein CXG81DRAFT_16413 [Caulochytrium protostelioides]